MIFFFSKFNVHTTCSMKCLSEVFFLIWQSFWSSLLHYPVMRLTYVFIFYFVWFWVFIYFFCEIARYVFFLYGRGLSRKRSKAVAAVAVGSWGMISRFLLLISSTGLFSKMDGWASSMHWTSTHDSCMSSTKTYMLNACTIIPHVWKLKCAAPHFSWMCRLLQKSSTFHLFSCHQHTVSWFDRSTTNGRTHGLFWSDRKAWMGRTQEQDSY